MSNPAFFGDRYFGCGDRYFECGHLYYVLVTYILEWLVVIGPEELENDYDGYAPEGFD